MCPELLAPVGDMNKLDIALFYGADAVYLSGKRLGMRAACKNFDGSELEAAVKRVHECGKKLYVTLNIFLFDEDFIGIDEYLELLSRLGVDGVIVSDIGLIKRIVRSYPRLDVHVSTQANVTNSDTACFYAELGAKRIVLARELSLGRIANIRAKLDSAVELEAFVHGAMCISYSGRCLLSAYTTGRSANRGECNQECRMRFTPENTHESFEFVEDDGTYIFGGNDLNMIEHLRDLVDAGIASFKIEGRVKSEYYVGCVVNAYRHALDSVMRHEPVPVAYINELYKAPNRGFNTGFYYGNPVAGKTTVRYGEFCALAVECDARGTVFEMRNRFRTGDVLEVLSPDVAPDTTVTVPVMIDTNGDECRDAKVPMCHVLFPNVYYPKLTMLRRVPDVCKHS